jgi:hypothetical protein
VRDRQRCIVLVSVGIISTYTIIFISILYYIGYIVCIEYRLITYVYVMYAERYQIIFITMKNNSFRFYYVSSKLDQVLLLLLLTSKLLLLRYKEKRMSKEHHRQKCFRFYYQLKDNW